MLRFLFSAAIAWALLFAAPAQAQTAISFSLSALSGDAAAPGYGAWSTLTDGDILHNNPNFGTYRSSQSEVCVIAPLPAPKVIHSAWVRGWNDRGVVGDGSNFTLHVYGSNTAPTACSVGTFGTLLGSQAFTEPNPGDNTLRSVTSTDQVTPYNYLTYRIVKTDGTGIALGEIGAMEITGGGGNPPPSTAKPYAIFIGAGQSNMEGQAPLATVTTYPNRDKVKAYYLNATWGDAVEPLSGTTGSQWTQFGSVNAATGPMMAFGDELAGLFRNFTPAVVVSAKGSTSITQWPKGGVLYDGMIARAQAALAAAPPGSFIAGFVWQQGESDTGSEAAALAWMQTLFPQLIANVRADLGKPNLPVVFAGLGPDLTGANATYSPAWPLMRFGQQAMGLPPLVRYVKTFDLPNSGGADWVITGSAEAVGRRLAQSMYLLLPQDMM